MPLKLGNYHIDFFIFCHHFWIVRLKLERDQNDKENFQNIINENKDVQNFTKVDEIIILLTFMKFHEIL